jgi:hypothetical protein
MLHVLPIAVALASVVLPLSTVRDQGDTAVSVREYKTVSRFLRAVDDYLVVQRLVGPLEPDNLCLPDDAYASARALAAVPLDERPAQREGDVFSPDVADLFRDRIAWAFRHSEFQAPDLAARLNAEELRTPPIVVNKPLPWGAGGATFTWRLAMLPLPTLPEGLEYRLIGHALVLVDLRANIVVDVLRDAVPLY